MADENEKPKLCPLNTAMKCEDCRLYTGNIPYLPPVVVNMEKRVMCVHIASTLLLAMLLQQEIQVQQMRRGPGGLNLPPLMGRG